jgi:hypothetical protein
MEKHLRTSLPGSALLNADNDFDNRTSTFAERLGGRSHALNPSRTAAQTMECAQKLPKPNPNINKHTGSAQANALTNQKSALVRNAD